VKLNLFNGGLNIRQAPELIKPNEAQVCSNIKFESGQLENTLGLAATSVTATTKPHYFLTENVWMPNGDTRSYVEYQGKLYWSDGLLAKKHALGVTQDLGIAAPTVVTAVPNLVAGVLTGTLQYVYTYYNVDDGTESQPSPISPDVTVTNSQVDISVTASLDTQVTHIRIYRIGATLLSFTRLVELPNATAVHTDNVADSSLATLQLNSSLNGKAPANLQYLTYSSGTFFGAVGNKLYFSHDIGNPNYWPETNYLDFRTPITALAMSSAGLLVFSRYQTHLVTGTSASNFVNYLVSGDQGCISHNTVASMGGSVIFLSTDGICTASGSLVTVVSKFKLGKQLYSPVNAVVFDEEYLCQLTDGSIIALDLRYEPAMETYDFQTNWLVVANDTLYGAAAAGLFEMFAGAAVAYTYVTGELTEQRISELKTYDDIYFYVTGTHTVKVFINNVLVATKVIVGAAKPQHLAIPQAKQRGSSIRFELTGIGIVKEIEYVAEGRENA